MSEQIYIERYWRDATPEDAIREPPMRARFRNGEKYTWDMGHLRGIRRDRIHPWYCQKLGSYSQCQVYDAPDPGEGWRLIDPRKQPLRVGDEFMLHLDRQLGWLLIDSLPTNWSQKNFYRRRIEQPKHEPRYEPFRWEDREQLRGRWYEVTLSSGEIRECQIEFLRLDRNVFFIGSFSSDELLEKNARFLDTGEPVGKKVMK